MSAPRLRLRTFLVLVGVILMGVIGAGCASRFVLQTERSTFSVSPTAPPTLTPTPTLTPRPTPTATPTVIPTGQIGNWNLIFSDDFNGAALDTDKWHTCYWWDKQGCTIISNNELEWYQPDNVMVKDGAVQLQALQRTINASNGNTYRYTSGMISSGSATSRTSSSARFAFLYGYAEMRAKVPKGKGLWPAFWLLPADHNSRPEIDVMEIIADEPNIVHLRYHYDAGAEAEDGGDVGSEWAGPDFSAGWHTFAINWRPDALVWYVDGVERWRYTDRSHIPAVPMYLLANLAVGGDWPGAPDASTPFPSSYLIDYIRVWKNSMAPADSLKSPKP